MFKYFFVLFLLFIPTEVWAKNSNTVTCDDCKKYNITKYVDFNLVDINEYWGNASGGIKHTTSYLGQTVGSVTIHMDKLTNYNIGSLYISGINVRGNPKSNTNLRTLDFISNIENFNSLKIYEFYYYNSFGNLNIKVGKFDFFSDFGHDDDTSQFLNASMITSMVINNNTYNMTNYGPSPSPGAELEYGKNGFDIKAGISSDNPYHGNFYKNFSNINSDNHGTDIYLNSPMINFELRYTSHINNLRGVYYIGGFYDFGKQANTYTNIFHSRNSAYYITINQEFLKTNTATYEWFFRYMIDPYSSKTNIKYTMDTGFLYKNKKSTIGIGFSITNPNHHLKLKYDNEYRLEVMYKYNLNNNITIQPDIQYIIHPGAEYKTNELVFGLRETFVY